MLDSSVAGKVFRKTNFRLEEFHSCCPDRDRSISFVSCTVNEQDIPDQQIEIPVGANSFGFEGVHMVFNCSRGKLLAVLSPRYELTYMDE